MTSTTIPPPLEQQRPQIICENEIKENNVVEEGRNRRALKDIGNLDAKQAKPSKPITRKELEKNKKSSTEFVNATTIVEPTKVRPTEVIVVSSDEESAEKKEIVIVVSSDEESAEKKEIRDVKGKKIREKSPRKNPKTLTSVLLARSEAASGQKNLIVNIDESEIHNQLAATDYIDDLYNYYRATENEILDYMASQPDINDKMRSILVDWLIDVHRKFELTPETLYLTINIIDRFLSIKVVPRKELQLLGISSMLIASKYEELWAPEVNDFACVSDNAYVRKQILFMEKTILTKLEWYITVPTPYVFLIRYIKASIPSDKEMECMVFFLAELSLVHYTTAILYRPSMIAASAVYAARCTLKRIPFWTKTLKHYTGYSKEQLRDCAKLMVSYHTAAPESNLRAVYKKFCSLDRCAVALVTPAKNLLAQS